MSVFLGKVRLIALKLCCSRKSEIYGYGAMGDCLVKKSQVEFQSRELCIIMAQGEPCSELQEVGTDSGAGRATMKTQRISQLGSHGATYRQLVMLQNFGFML